MIFYSKQRNLSVVTIAKNGSETIIKSICDDFTQVKNPKNKQLVIIRDPVSRWISGIVEQSLYGPHVKGLRSIESMLKSCAIKVFQNNVGHEDYHTEPQVDFLYDLPTLYYYMTPTVFEDINRDHNIFKSIKHLHLSTEGKRLEYTQALKNWVVANQKAVDDWAKLVYADDYKLIENSHFVNR